MFDVDSGVQSYARYSAEIEIGFPVDWYGKAHIACEFCKLFSGKTCRLTGEIVYNPEKYVGHECPLEFIEECDDDV